MPNGNEELRAVNAADKEAFRSVIAFALTTVNAAMLINGGAAIALLAFLGNLEPDRLVSTRPHSAFALFAFAIGVLAGASGAALGYFTQYRYQSDFVLTGKPSTLGICLHCAAIIVVFLAFFLFVLGVGLSYWAIFS